MLTNSTHNLTNTGNYVIHIVLCQNSPRLIGTESWANVRSRRGHQFFAIKWLTSLWDKVFSLSLLCSHSTAAFNACLQSIHTDYTISTLYLDLLFTYTCKLFT